MVVVLLIRMVSKNGNENSIYNTYSNDDNTCSRSGISLSGFIQSGSVQDQATYRAVQSIVRGLKKEVRSPQSGKVRFTISSLSSRKIVRAWVVGARVILGGLTYSSPLKYLKITVVESNK